MCLPSRFGGRLKPELLAVLAMLDDEEALIICNGYKDEEYVETALLGSKIGRTIILVVEKPSELQLIARIAHKTGVRPCIGMRAKLATRGSGRWKPPAGTIRNLVSQHVNWWRAWGFYASTILLDSFELLHFHLGSQISNIRNIKEGLREAGRFYGELVKLDLIALPRCGWRPGSRLRRFTNQFSVLHELRCRNTPMMWCIPSWEMCEEAEVTPPTLVSESVALPWHTTASWW